MPSHIITTRTGARRRQARRAAGLSTLVMHHLPDDLKRLGLAEIVRVLKPGGRLVIIDFKRAQEQPGQDARLGAGSLGLQDLPRQLEEAGCSQIESAEIPFPRLMGLAGAGYIRARIKLSLV